MSLYYIVSAYLNNGVGKNAPGKKATEKIALRKIPPWKIALQTIAPRKIVLLDFYCFWHYHTVVPFKTFYSN